MEKIVITRKWMDRISVILTFIVVGLIVYTIGNAMPDEHAQEIGSGLAIFTLLIIVPIGQTVDKFMGLFLNDGRK